ncbi:hypothetical protein K439DRAFT_918912 [Ramaria rubella]|nr:hypothetical protein K439DRAFT_918912 [Ramaria rubella]
MSHNPQDYYTSGRRGDSSRRGDTGRREDSSRHREETDNRLPPLRHALPEFFPTLPSTYLRPPSDHYRDPSSDRSTPSPARTGTNRDHHSRYSLTHRNDPIEPFARFTPDMENTLTSNDPRFPSRRPSGDNDHAHRNHVCEECGSRFDRPNALEIHMRIHTKERPYLCSHPGCDKAFTVRSNLTRHERTHQSYSAFESVDEPTYGSSSSASSSRQPRAGGTSKATDSYYTSSSKRNTKK